MSAQPKPRPERPTAHDVVREAGRLADFNAIAVFPSMREARSAIDALERGGVEAAMISLLGPGAEEAAQNTDTRGRDERSFLRLGRRTILGVVAGAVTGAVIGFLIGLFVFGLPGAGPVMRASVWYAALGGAAAGAIVAGIVGAYSSVDMTPAFELTLEPIHADHVLVGVHTSDRDAAERGAGILRSVHPVAIHLLDRSGRPIAGGSAEG
jgi:hypothetical protein